jgi:hypothetical protein
MVREGNTKAFGYISKVYAMNSPPKDLIDNFTANDAKVGTFATGATAVEAVPSASKAVKV